MENKNNKPKRQPRVKTGTESHGSSLPSRHRVQLHEDKIAGLPKIVTELSLASHFGGDTIMKLLRVSMAIAAFVLAQPVLAQGGPPNGKGPIGRLQSAVEELASQIGDVEALTARIEDLEELAHDAPDSSVAWRTYCRRNIITIFLGNPDPGIPGRLVTIESVQTASFVADGLETPEVGEVEIDTVTRTVGVLTKFDTTALFGPFDDPLADADYQQSGTRIDVTFDDGNVLNLYGSKDGSLLHGTNVFQEPNRFDPNFMDVVVVESVFAEIDGVDATCGNPVDAL
jgi:hypothetical protein